MKIEITATLPANASADLLDFASVTGRWEVSDSSFQHLVAAVAAAEAAALTAGEVHEDDVKVELFRSDGRSLDGSDGITSGSMLVTRRR